MKKIIILLSVLFAETGLYCMNPHKNHTVESEDQNSQIEAYIARLSAKYIVSDEIKFIIDDAIGNGFCPFVNKQDPLEHKLFIYNRASQKTDQEYPLPFRKQITNQDE